MTQQEWLDCEMISRLLREIKSKRKLHLFAIATCRNYSNNYKLIDPENFLHRLELFIDGQLSEIELRQLYNLAGVEGYFSLQLALDPKISPSSAFILSRQWEPTGKIDFRQHTEFFRQLIKDIYNPNLTPLTFPQKAIELAQEVYDTNNPITRFILSDFLEEFNFPEELYLHLKQTNHYKGCWVIDQILNKN